MAISKRDNMLGAIHDTCICFGYDQKSNVTRVGNLVGLARDASLLVFKSTSTPGNPFDRIALSYKKDVEYAVATGILNGLRRPTQDFDPCGKYIDGEQSKLAAPFEEDILSYMRGRLGMANTNADNLLNVRVRDTSHKYPFLHRAGDAMRVIIAAGTIAGRNPIIVSKARKLELVLNLRDFRVYVVKKF